MSIRSNPDMRRMGNGVSYPGIDPRQWIKYAKVTDTGYDPAHGLFADVQFEGTGQNETCLIGSTYAGKDYGENYPLEDGSRVLVFVPGGNADNGPVILCQVWDAFHTPPAEFNDLKSNQQDPDPTQDRIIKVKKGQRYRLITEDGDVLVETAGSGNISIETTGTGITKIKSATKAIVEASAVELGNTGPVDPIALSTGTVAFLKGLQSSLDGLNAALIAFCNSLSTSPISGPAATLGSACSTLATAISALSAQTIPSVTTKST